MIYEGPHRRTRYLRSRTFFQRKSRLKKTPDGASEAAPPQLKSPPKFKSPFFSNGEIIINAGVNPSHANGRPRFASPKGTLKAPHSAEAFPICIYKLISGAGVDPSQTKLVRPRFTCPKRPLKASNDAEDILASTNHSHAGVSPSLTNTVGPRFHPLEFPLNKANNLAEEASVSMKFTTTPGAQAPRTPARSSGSGPSPPFPSRWDLVGRRPELGRDQHQQGVKRFGAVFHPMGSRLSRSGTSRPPWSWARTTSTPTNSR